MVAGTEGYNRFTELFIEGNQALDFDFILIDAVWHHLNEIERASAATRFSTLIKQGGKCAISLRNGPAGMVSKIYPTDSGKTIEQFGGIGFKCILHLKNQSSIYSFKKDVKWSRIVLQKT